MNPQYQSVTFVDMFRTVWKYRLLIVVPTLLGFVLAAVWSLIMPREWKAVQGLLIRAEAAGIGEDRLGKFSDLSEMKTIQETILELAKSQSVVTAVLTKVGPPKSLFGHGEFPTPQDIVDFRDKLIMTPPGGAEFGKTEVFYLGALAGTSDRAQALVEALSDELDTRMRQIRNEKTQSMIDELSQGVVLAERELQLTIDRVSRFEQENGANIAELRNLVSPNATAGEHSQSALAIESELRGASTERRRLEKLIEVLTAAEGSPRSVVTMPSSLFAAQPSLERLRQGLVDAQLATARLMGGRTEAHPAVVASLESEREIESQLAREISEIRGGLLVELDLVKDRESSLAERLSSHRGSLLALAGKRAPYAQLLADVDNQTRLTDAARKRLADAESRHVGAGSASVLARIDAVERGVRPVGPGRAVVALAGGLAGMVFGTSLVFLLFGPQPKIAIAEVPPPAARREQRRESPLASRSAISPVAGSVPFGAEYAGYSSQSVASY